MRKSTLKNAAACIDYFARDNGGTVPAEVNRGYVEKLVAAGVIPSASWLFKKENLGSARGMYRITDEILHMVEVFELSGEVVEPPAARRAAMRAPVATAPAPSPVASAPAPETDTVSAVVPINPKSADRLASQTATFEQSLVPRLDPLFVPFGAYESVRSILKSGTFFPIFITGLSGNGKTHLIQQAAAKAKREVIRVNFTRETDEDDLIGGLRMVDGDTVFMKGPVIRAMERGAVLLLDEVDVADPAKVLCLQSIAEGSGYFIKKTGEFIEPADGFTIVATANTKGRGSDTGHFVGTNIQNEAFLERFVATFEQPYPDENIEKRILIKVFESLGLDTKGESIDFIKNLCSWASVVRQSYFEEIVEDIISTRRLVHIAKAFSIFKDRYTAVKMCVDRFDDETRESFLDLYTKIDAEAKSDTASNTASNTVPEGMPF